MATFSGILVTKDLVDIHDVKIALPPILGTSLASIFIYSSLY